MYRSGSELARLILGNKLGSAEDPLRSDDPLLLSGASDGADTVFGAAALAAGHRAAHLLGPTNEPSVRAVEDFAVYRVDEGALDDPRVVCALESAAAARREAPEAWEASKRNYLQVCRAGAVYAVGYRQPGDVPALDVGGGAGFAAQFYVDRFLDGDGCRLFFFDDSPTDGWAGCKVVPATHGRWNAWDVDRETWTPLARPPPRPSGVYAGIGATRLSRDGEAAIEALYNTG